VVPFHWRPSLPPSQRFLNEPLQLCCLFNQYNFDELVPSHFLQPSSFPMPLFAGWLCYVFGSKGFSFWPWLSIADLSWRSVSTPSFLCKVFHQHQIIFPTLFPLLAPPLEAFQYPPCYQSFHWSRNLLLLGNIRNASTMLIPECRILICLSLLGQRELIRKFGQCGFGCIYYCAEKICIVTAQVSQLIRWVRDKLLIRLYLNIILK
jgi:hypothetical protein